MTDRKLTLYYAPRSRSSTTRVLMDELGMLYDLSVLNMRAGEMQSSAYLAINPLGKVPALQHGDTIVTESIAIALYLADLYPEAGLTPAITDPRRADYMRWMVFYAASFEPAVVDKAVGNVVPPETAPYGSYDKVVAILAAHLETSPYMLGDRISVADIIWGASLRWLLMFNLLPDLPVFKDYAARITSRPSFQNVFADEVRLDAEHEVAAKAVRPI
ncbi:glutathione S-transferase family protein [Pannonibacter sp.]|uniref:glutathione S-transferase family protein n=1 Tax=Pannonibacter sp. TaxID=1906786 RepID=UPI003F6E4B28